jgi:hypothetical protein
MVSPMWLKKISDVAYRRSQRPNFQNGTTNSHFIIIIIIIKNLTINTHRLEVKHYVARISE